MIVPLNVVITQALKHETFFFFKQSIPDSICVIQQNSVGIKNKISILKWKCRSYSENCGRDEAYCYYSTAMSMLSKLSHMLTRKE